MAKYLMPYGVVKIVEFICTLIAWATIVDQYNADTYIFEEGNRIRPSFHITICIIAWILSILAFILLVALPNIASKINTASYALSHFIVGCLVLIAASLMCDTFSQHSGYHTYKAGAAFGIIGAVVIIADAFLFVVRPLPKDE